MVVVVVVLDVLEVLDVVVVDVLEEVVVLVLLPGTGINVPTKKSNSSQHVFTPE